MYLTYDEYTKMGGELSETAFDSAVNKACAEIDYYTFGRLANQEISGCVKKCVFELTELYNKQSAHGIGSQTSAGNDGFSVSYNIPNVETLNEITHDEAMRCINRYLFNEKTADGIPLLYRGAI